MVTTGRAHLSTGVPNPDTPREETCGRRRLSHSSELDTHRIFPFLSTWRSGGVQTLDHVGDLIEDLLSLTHEALDLLDGVDDRGVIPASE